eukprot:409603-Hanusia_phi.AAC.2
MPSQDSSTTLRLMPIPELSLGAQDRIRIDLAPRSRFRGSILEQTSYAFMRSFLKPKLNAFHSLLTNAITVPALQLNNSIFFCTIRTVRLP